MRGYIDCRRPLMLESALPNTKQWGTDVSFGRCEEVWAGKRPRHTPKRRPQRTPPGLLPLNPGGISRSEGRPTRAAIRERPKRRRTGTAPPRRCPAADPSRWPTPTLLKERICSMQIKQTCSMKTYISDKYISGRGRRVTTWCGMADRTVSRASARMKHRGSAGETT